MPVYTYKALTEEGKRIAGAIDADSLFMAKEKLKNRGVFVTEVVSQKERKKYLTLSGDQLMSFTREMRQLLTAGLPLYESLITMEEKYRHHKIHPLLISLCDEIKSGRSLSYALSQHEKVFDSIYLAIIRSSEQSGQLVDAFSSVYELLGKQHKLKKQLKASLAYPSMLGLFCLVIVFFLLFFIIPSMQELFEGRPVHPMTALVLSASHLATENIGVFISLFCIPFATAFFAFKNNHFKKSLFSFLSRAPFIGRVMTLSAMVRFFRCMHLLLIGGLPLLDALAYSKRAMHHPTLEDAAGLAEKGLVEGKKLSSLLIHPLIPSLVGRMVAIAEETGALPSAVESLANIFEEDLDKDLAQLTTYLQPAILLFLGLVIGFVVLSILLPLTDVSSFLSN